MGNQITQGLGQAWAVLVTFVPKLLGFLLIMLIGWLIAKAISKAVGFLLQRIGFSRLVEKSGLNGLMANSRVDAADLIVKVVYYFILLIALQFAFSAFGAGNPVSQLLNEIVSYLPRVIVAIVLVIIAAAIAKAVRGLVNGALGNRPIGPVLGTVSYIFILALGIFAALGQLEIATTVTLPVLITVLGTIGGILVVGVGGGLITPMKTRWEGWLTNLQSQAKPQVGANSGQHHVQTQQLITDTQTDTPSTGFERPTES